MKIKHVNCKGKCFDNKITSKKLLVQFTKLNLYKKSYPALRLEM